MATLDYTVTQALAKFRVFSDDETETWTSSGMRTHDNVGNYGTDGVLTPTTAAAAGGDGSRTKHTVTLPALPDNDYKLVGFVSTPVKGGYWIGDPFLKFNVHDGAVTSDADQWTAIDNGGGGGGGGLTEEEVRQIVDEQIAALQAGQISGGNGPVQADLTLVLTSEVDHIAANDNACQWVIADYAGPDVSGAAVKLKLYERTAYEGLTTPTPELEVAGTAAVTDGNATFTVDVTATDLESLSSTFPPAEHMLNYYYKLTLTLGDGKAYNLLQPAGVRACSVIR